MEVSVVRVCSLIESRLAFELLGHGQLRSIAIQMGYNAATLPRGKLQASRAAELMGRGCASELKRPWGWDEFVEYRMLSSDGSEQVVH